MDSGADARRASAHRIEMLESLRERLVHAEALVSEMQHGLVRADAETIENAGARLDSVLLEFKVLAEEYGRAPVTSTEETTSDERRAHESLEAAATRLARSCAVGGGLLERLVTISRRLTGTLQAARGETYLPTGRTRELAGEGLRLREKA
jgi:hypothetical protein